MKEITSPSQLKTTKTYYIQYKHLDKPIKLGKFEKIEKHREEHLMSYGSGTTLPTMIKFNDGSVSVQRAFPIDGWDRMDAPIIYEVESGGRRRTNKRSRQRHRRKSRISKRKSKSSKKRRTRRR